MILCVTITRYLIVDTAIVFVQGTSINLIFGFGLYLETGNFNRYYNTTLQSTENNYLHEYNPLLQFESVFCTQPLGCLLILLNAVFKFMVYLRPSCIIIIHLKPVRWSHLRLLLISTLKEVQISVVCNFTHAYYCLQNRSCVLCIFRKTVHRISKADKVCFSMQSILNFASIYSEHLLVQ